MNKDLWRIGADVPAGFRTGILQRFHARHPQVFCKQITWAYGVDGDFYFPTWDLKCSVYGYHETATTQALALCVDEREYRPDGKLFHLTISTANGVPPVKAGELMVAHGIRPVAPIDCWLKFERFPLWKQKASMAA